ncbi:unnamed protein product [Microthlaspi erraticum]|uniref:Reverse transcriptase zinc-binding domain-containing protein n=1 Tax=Microthlaspi erraticum TaxID=1685480 RepID=A0A6D2LF29_9BRAS|nr:unnamed protein product [Microthlaspi erraticum]
MSFVFSNSATLIRTTTNSLEVTGSWIWKSLLKSREVARPHLVCKVNSGSKALFWHDNWTDLGPLIELTGANGPRVTGINRMATVNQACNNSAWLISGGRHPILRLLRDVLPINLPTSLNSLQDVFRWKSSPTADPGDFSSTKTWDFLHPTGPPLIWTKPVWFKERIPRHTFILWLVIKDRLVTRDRLRSWGLDVPSSCLLCDSAPETKHHLLNDCAYSKEIWTVFFRRSGLSLPSSIEDIVTWSNSPSPVKKVNTICKIFVQAIVYCLWRERNSRLHTPRSKPVHVLTKEIQTILRAKLFSLDRSSITAVAHRSSLDSENSFLHTSFSLFHV